jgi:hypothetical protein
VDLITASGVRRRSHWCPACKESWIRARIGTNRCPICDGRLIAFVDRFTHELQRGSSPISRAPGRYVVDGVRTGV